MSFTIPTYEYPPEGIGSLVARLLNQFLHANRDRKRVAEEIGVSVEVLNDWARGEITVGLTSSSMKRFVETTGIDLDRILVIDAKKCILDGLRQIDRLRLSDPQFAFLLELNPELETLISFDDYFHRDDILEEASKIAERIGDPLFAYQIFANERYVATWWNEYDRRQRPAGEFLIRLIIRLYAGFDDLCQDSPTIDDVRFRVITRNALGCNPSEILGVKNLHEAIAKLFAGKEQWQTQSIANQIGINAPVVKRLREWNAKNSSGKMTANTIGNIIRALLKENGHEDKISAFNRALDNFEEKGSRGWTKDPVFWPSGGNATTTPQPPENLPTAQPLSVQPSDRLVAPTKPDAATPTVNNKQDDERTISLFARIEFERAIATLNILLREFPKLGAQIPESWTQPVAPQQPEDRFEGLCQNKQALDEEAAEELVRVFRGLPKIVDRLMRSNETTRNSVLKRIDGSLVEMQNLLDASGSPNPEHYLAQVVRPQKRAHQLLSSHPNRKS